MSDPIQGQSHAVPKVVADFKVFPTPIWMYRIYSHVSRKIYDKILT